MTQAPEVTGGVYCTFSALHGQWNEECMECALNVAEVLRVAVTSLATLVVSGVFPGVNAPAFIAFKVFSAVAFIRVRLVYCFQPVLFST